MKAAILDAPERIRVGDWETPRPGPGEALIAVEAAGVCAGDLYLYQGKHPYGIYPQIAGHEIAGRIVEPGDGVSGLAAGSPVVVEPFIGCGECYPCGIGRSNCCTNLKIIGVHLPGGFAEFVTAPERLIHPVPDGLSLTLASFAEPVAIGVQACRRGMVDAGEFVLVLGCGPIGLAIIEVARARGARVAATDVLDVRLSAARELGAETLPADHKLVSRILEMTNGAGAAVVLEATGNPMVMEQTVELVASGGRIVIVGLVKKGVRVSLPGLDFTRKEMTIVGSRASVNCFPEALALLASGKIRYPRAATEFSLWDAPGVFRNLDERPGSVQKAVLIA